jgi:hypothetical protein
MEKKAILTATKITKADGSKAIAGYKIALPKTEMERCGFKERDKLNVTISEGEVRIKK